MVYWVAYVFAFVFLLESTHDVAIALVAPLFLFIFLLWPLVFLLDLLVIFLRAIFRK